MSEPTSAAAIPGPREVFARMRQQWLSNDPDSPLMGGQLADDVVIESPFAPPGRPRRFEGREQWLAFAEPGRASLPVRFEECRNVVIHDTTDYGKGHNKYFSESLKPLGGEIGEVVLRLDA